MKKPKPKFRIGDILFTLAGSRFEVIGIKECDWDYDNFVSWKCSGIHYVLKNHPHNEVCIQYAEKYFIGGTKAAQVLYGQTK